MSASSKNRTNVRVAVDAVIFTVDEDKLKVLLIEMKKKPYTGKWAFPGGEILPGETTEKAARRILSTQTGVSQVYLEQLATFDEPSRDTLGRVISVAYFALIPSADVKLKTTERYADVRWWTATQLPKLAYDHNEMAKVAIDRLRAKLEYTNVVWSLLPERFTLTTLQRTYEAILGRDMDKRNFRKKILSLGLLTATGGKTEGETHRPAALYRFKRRELAQVEML